MKNTIVPATLRVISGGPFEKPALPFEVHFRPPQHPKAARLRKAYRLLEAAGHGDDFDRARNLKCWVRSRWNHGWDNENQEDALTILARAARGGTFHCGFYARVFVQCCLSIGLVARLANVSRKQMDFPDACLYNAGHSVVEVYCRELGKWVVLDADANCFYTHRGIPAGLIEIQRAWVRDHGASLKQVFDEPAFVEPRTCPVVSDRYLRRMWREFRQHRAVDFYHYVTVTTVNGYEPLPRAVRQTYLIYSGVVPPPLAIGYRGTDLEAALFAENAEVFNWPVDRTFLRARMAGGRPASRVEVRLAHTMPFFRGFEVKVGQQPFRAVRADRLVISLPSGRTNIRARCVDWFGRPGHEARLVVELKPASPAVLRGRTRKYWLE